MMAKRPKHSELSADDRKHIERMIRKYGGRGKFLALAGNLKPSVLGKPSSGDAYWKEALDIHSFISNRVDEYRHNGSKAPTKDAYRDLFKVMVPLEKQTPTRFRQFVKTKGRMRSAVSKAADSYVAAEGDPPKR